MTRTEKEIVLLVIGILVSPLVFKGQCNDAKDEEPHFIVFPKVFFSSNADHVKQFLSRGVLNDDVTDKTRKPSQEPPLSPSSDESNTSLDVEKTTGVVSDSGVASETLTDLATSHLRNSNQEPTLSLSADESTPISLSIQEITGTISPSGVLTETVTDNYAAKQAMTSHTNPPAAALPNETTASRDVQITTRAESCQELSPPPANRNIPICYTASTADAVQWYTWNNIYYAFVYQSEMNWDDAKQHCNLFCEGAHLVFLESEQESRLVSCLAFQVNGPRLKRWWIGLSDRDEEGSWKWNDVPATYQNWREGEPNNGKGYEDEDCGALITRDGDTALWNDVPCNRMRHFICEKDVKVDN